MLHMVTFIGLRYSGHGGVAREEESEGERGGQRIMRDRRKKPEKKRGRERGTGRRDIAWWKKPGKRGTEEKERRHE